MAVEFTDALLRLVAEHEDLLVLGLPEDRTRDARARDERGADLDLATGAREHDPVERNVTAGVCVNEIGSYDIALGDAQLLAAGLNDRVHNRDTIPGHPRTVNAGTGRLTYDHVARMLQISLNYRLIYSPEAYVNPSEAREHLAVIERIIAASSRKLEAGGEFFVVWGVAGASTDVIFTLAMMHRLPMAALWINLAVLCCAIVFSIVRSRSYRESADTMSLLQREYLNVLMLAIAVAFVTQFIGFNLFPPIAAIALWNVVETLVLLYIGMHGNRRAQIGAITLLVSIALANFMTPYAGLLLAAGTLIGYGGFGVADLLARE